MSSKDERKQNLGVPMDCLHLLLSLKELLGKKFADHFQETENPEPGAVASLAKLTLFLTAATHHADKQHQFTSSFSTLAKEVCLIAIVIDRALTRFGTHYSRGWERLCEMDPRNSFQLRYKLGGLNVGLMYGLTDPEGETESNAM
ncbi:hypothetical protein FRB95_011068 [Tulasnella sp. JGI-2019a]|nr:hypothetical protein FRB95_011068 [Tulasnella sp. JGI-2019a]